MLVLLATAWSGHYFLVGYYILRCIANQNGISSSDVGPNCGASGSGAGAAPATGGAGA